MAVTVEYPRITLFGASIIQYSFGRQGLSTRLADLYQRRVDIVTRGFEGYTSKWALPLAKPTFDSIGKKHEAIIIFIGTNDASIPGSPFAIPEQEFVVNMNKITETALEYTDTVVLVGNTLVDELAPLSADMRSNKRALEYSKLLQEVAKKYDAEFIDLWSLFRTHNGESGIEPGSGLLAGEKGYEGDKQVGNFVHDGIHFTAEASDLFFDGVMKALDKRGKGVNSYETVIPPWIDLYQAEKAAKPKL